MLTLAASALAAKIPRVGEKGLYDRTFGFGGGWGFGGGYGHGQGKPGAVCKGECETVTTEVIYTYTTLCPITQIISEPGHTYTTTFTTTSTVEEVVLTTIVVTKTAPPVTKTEGEGEGDARPPARSILDASLTVDQCAVVYTTKTELCPVIETTVVGGSTVEITWTSTSTIVTQVQQTQTVFTTSVVTEYETTDVYETVRRLLCPLHNLYVYTCGCIWICTNTRRRLHARSQRTRQCPRVTPSR